MNESIDGDEGPNDNHGYEKRANILDSMDIVDYDKIEDEESGQLANGLKSLVFIHGLG